MMQLFSETIAACFIEGNEDMHFVNKRMITSWLQDVWTTVDLQDRTYENYMKIEVVGAKQRHHLVWDAIQKSDHIWCQTIFEAKSAELCIKMLAKAKEAGLRDKCIFNLANDQQALSHLCYYQSKARYLIENLAAHNNIQFYFVDKICAMKAGPDGIVIDPHMAAAARSIFIL